MRGLRTIGTGTGLLALFLAAAAPPAPAPTERKSLVLISLDTARADHFGCYGYGQDTTPHIDRLAREGVLFERAFSHAVNTTPSHVSLFTGHYPISHGSRFNGVPLNAEFPTLATILSGAGYQTGGFVSGYTMVASQSGLNRGFDVYDDGFSGQDRLGAETVDRALDWLRKRDPSRPYFLFVHLFDPHGKYDPPKGFAERFRKGHYAPIPDPEAIPEYQRLEHGEESFSREPLDYISRYDGEINYTDAQVGRLLAAAGDRPVVVVTADHGETLVDRDYYFSHGARLTEEAVRVPLILRFPDKALGRKKVSGLAQLVDVVPTLLSYLELPVPRRIPGTNLLPAIRAGTIPAARTIISEGRAEGRRFQASPGAGSANLIFSARNARYKVICLDIQPKPVLELYDLENDPAEKHDLAEARAQLASSLFQTIDLYLVTGKPPAPPELDEETKKKLRSLGYVN